MPYLTLESPHDHWGFYRSLTICSEHLPVNVSVRLWWDSSAPPQTSTWPPTHTWVSYLDSVCSRKSPTVCGQTDRCLNRCLQWNHFSLLMFSVPLLLLPFSLCTDRTPITTCLKVNDSHLGQLMILYKGKKTHWSYTVAPNIPVPCGGTPTSSF